MRKGDDVTASGETGGGAGVLVGEPAAHPDDAGGGCTDHRTVIRTVIDALEAVAREDRRGFTFYDQDLVAHHWPYAELVREARRRGRYLRSLGLARGARVALVIPDNADFVLTFYGAISAGLVPVPMVPPHGPRQRGYAETAITILAASGAELVVTSALFSPMVEPLRAALPHVRGVAFTEAMRDPADDHAAWHEPQAPGPDDPCFLQFTSGSTARPKGVVVTHGNLVANAHAILRERLQIDITTDLALAWLPLYHDMGLIGFVCAPLIIGLGSVLLPTLKFMFRPSLWMQLIHEHRATMTFGPNFAYGLIARRQGKLDELDLSCLRVIGCGAEPIMADTMRQFAEAFAPARLRPEAVMPAYGMAEHTLAVTFEDPSEPLRTLVIDRDAYETSGEVRPLPADSPRRAIELVSCGKPFAGHAVAIMKDGVLLGPGRVGEVVLRGPSATRGYFGDAAATAALFTEGWMRTGDLGFVYDGNLYVSGRVKDLIIVNGKNHYPQDIEWQLEALPELRKGGVVAFGVARDATERVVIVAEVRGEVTTALREAIEARVAEVTGASPAEIVFVPRNTLPKTSSGKVQRRKTRALYLDRAFQAVAREPQAAAVAGTSS